MPSYTTRMRMRALRWTANPGPHVDTPDEALMRRAQTILKDGLPHAPAAIAWAQRTLGVIVPPPGPPEAPGELVDQSPVRAFTLRELSLGAQA